MFIQLPVGKNSSIFEFKQIINWLISTNFGVAVKQTDRQGEKPQCSLMVWDLGIIGTWLIFSEKSENYTYDENNWRTDLLIGKEMGFECTEILN